MTEPEDDDGLTRIQEADYQRLKRYAAASALLTLIGLLVTGPAGLGFLFETVGVPVWFLLVAFLLPTGETLAIMRHWLRAKKPRDLDRIK